MISELQCLARPLRRLRETKQKLSGAVSSFDIECWRWDPAQELVVGRWVAEPDNLFGAPAGSFSWGVWGRGAFGPLGLGAYRLHAPDGVLQRYRFDVLGAVKLRPGSEGRPHELLFEDLLLDCWVSPGGELDWEDREEMMAAAEAGLLSGPQLAEVEAAQEALLRDAGQLTGAVDEAVEEAIRRRRDDKAGVAV